MIGVINPLSVLTATLTSTLLYLREIKNINLKYHRNQPKFFLTKIVIFTLIINYLIQLEKILGADKNRKRNDTHMC